MLKKNTIGVCFLNVNQNKDKSSVWVDFKHPLSQVYNFYVSPKTRKNIDIGTMIANDETKNEYAVIVNNFTEYKSQDNHKELNKIYPHGHLRTYLKEVFNIDRKSKPANVIYYGFRSVSHPYWERFYADEK